MGAFTLKRNQPQKRVPARHTQQEAAAFESTLHPILHLQRIIGNQAVLRNLQAKTQPAKAAGVPITRNPGLGLARNTDEASIKQKLKETEDILKDSRRNAEELIEKVTGKRHPNKVAPSGRRPRSGAVDTVPDDWLIGRLNEIARGGGAHAEEAKRRIRELQDLKGEVKALDRELKAVQGKGKPVATNFKGGGGGGNKVKNPDTNDNKSTSKRTTSIPSTSNIDSVGEMQNKFTSRVAITPLLIESALSGIRIWALINLKSENDAKIKRDKTRIEEQIALIVNAEVSQQAEKIADYWIDFQPVYANITTMVMAEWLTHMAMNTQGMPSGPPDQYMRYLGSHLVGMYISNSPDSSSSSQVIGKDMLQNTITTQTLEMITAPILLPVDNALVRARLKGRIKRLDQAITQDPLSSSLQSARMELQRRLALFQS